MWDGMTDSQNKTIEATGGDAITSSDTITLCGRYDKIASRCDWVESITQKGARYHIFVSCIPKAYPSARSLLARYYDGQLANLMVWSAPLGDGEVQQLYRAYTSAGPSPGTHACVIIGCV